MKEKWQFPFTKTVSAPSQRDLLPLVADLLGLGRVGQRVEALPEELRAEVERHVRAGYLAGLPDGPRSFAIIVRAVRGTVPAGG